jgi:hypothetical protein
MRQGDLLQQQMGHLLRPFSSPFFGVELLLDYVLGNKVEALLSVCIIILWLPLK